MAFLPSFLASRVAISGSGGFDPFHKGFKYSLSPKAHFLQHVANNETTHARPMVNLRDEPLSANGHHRLHLITADANGSETAMWLRFATTALVVAMLESPKKYLELKNEYADSLAAAHQIAVDQTLGFRAKTKGGQMVTALEMQRMFYDAVCKFVNDTQMPEWVPNALRVWDRTIRRLTNDSDAMAATLDWSIKKAVYSEFSEANGVPWEHWPKWSKVIEKLTDGGFVTGGLLTTSLNASAKRDIERLECDPKLVEQVMNLKLKLYELDYRYLQVRGGIFESLDAAGALRHKVITNRGSIKKSVTVPPSGGRAEVRGNYVQQNAGKTSGRVYWHFITHGHDLAKMSDPFFNGELKFARNTEGY